MSCFVQIVSCCTLDATPCLCVWTDTQRSVKDRMVWDSPGMIDLAHRILINAGEGTQRICVEHKIRVSKVSEPPWRTPRKLLGLIHGMLESGRACIVNGSGGSISRRSSRPLPDCSRRWKDSTLNHWSSWFAIIFEHYGGFCSTVGWLHVVYTRSTKSSGFELLLC